MRNSVSDVTDAEILDEAREAMTQAAFDAADEANAAQAVESATESLPAFDELGLSDEMLRAIENLGYTAPTPVQAGSIPVVLEGRDLPMRAGDLLVAPDGVPHGVHNTGGERLIVLAILAPGPGHA